MRSPTERPQGKKRTRSRAELGGGQLEQGGLEQINKEKLLLQETVVNSASV